jgi:hypothetical protein
VQTGAIWSGAMLNRGGPAGAAVPNRAGMSSSEVSE